MSRVIGLCIAIVVGVVMVINAGFMLASPGAWFHLPTWLRMQGSLTESDYTQGWRAIQIRLVGAAVLGAIAWVVYDML